LFSRGFLVLQYTGDDFEIKSNAFDVCYGNPCYSQSDCCSETICIKHHGQGIGKCNRLTAQSEGALCSVKQIPPACNKGLICHALTEYPKMLVGLCTTPSAVYQNGAAGEKCKSTIDCNFAGGLCCRSRIHGRAAEIFVCQHYDDLLVDCLFSAK